MTRLSSQDYKVNRLSSTVKKFYGRHTDSWIIREKFWLIVSVKMAFFSRFFPVFVKAELVKLAKMAGVMHEADHPYSIQGTW